MEKTLVTRGPGLVSDILQQKKNQRMPGHC